MSNNAVSADLLGKTAPAPSVGDGGSGEKLEPKKLADAVAQSYLMQAIYGDILKRATHVSIPSLVNYAHAHAALSAMYLREVIEPDANREEYHQIEIAAMQDIISQLRAQS